MKPLTEKQQLTISKNVIAACKDINKLSAAGYEFLYLCPGFIAHYDRAGFIDYYREPGSLQRDIQDNGRFNQWTNFRIGEKNADYYHSMRDTYNRILCGLADQFAKDHFLFVHVKG